MNNSPIFKIFPFFVLLFILAITGCGNIKKPASGLEDEIIVIADSVDYYNLEASLLHVFGKIIYTPQPEKLFELTRKDLIQLGKQKGKKNILIIAPLNSGSPVAEFIKGTLDSTVRKLVEENKEFVFNKYDMWAKNQLVMILASPTTEQLNENILKDNENLVYYFQKVSNKRLMTNLYSDKFEKKDVEANLLNKYGWIIYVQADFDLALDKPEDSFVWLRRGFGTNIERWVFVHWVENASPDFLDKDSIYSKRNYLTEKYYRTSSDTSYVEISDNYLTVSEVNFRGKYAVMTQGLWRMSDQSMGGPFINYTFYDEKTKRIYMLDGSLYAPKYYKKSLIQQLDVLLQSFNTGHELSADRTEDLLDHLK